MTLGNATLTTGSDNSSTTFSGGISGAGGLVKTGTGTFILTGANNTYTDGTTISGGTLQGYTTSLQGNIVDNAALVFDLTTGTFAGSITGAGTLVKQNSGLFVLSGNSGAFTGATSIIGGILAVGDANNPAAGNPRRRRRRWPRGHFDWARHDPRLGQQYERVVASGGSIGTLTVGGKFTQGNAGTLAVKVSPTGASQLVVGGKASLAGTLALVYNPGTYSANTYPLVQAASVSGNPTVTGQVPTPGLTQLVTIDRTDVQLPLGGVTAPTNDTIFSAMTSTLILNGQQANVMVLDRLGARLGAGPDAPATAGLAAPASLRLPQIGEQQSRGGRRGRLGPAGGNRAIWRVVPRYRQEGRGSLRRVERQLHRWLIAGVRTKASRTPGGAYGKSTRSNTRGPNFRGLMRSIRGPGRSSCSICASTVPI